MNVLSECLKPSGDEAPLYSADIMDVCICGNIQRLKTYEESEIRNYIHILSIEACRYGHIKIMQFLLKFERLDINSCMIITAYYGHLDIFKLIMRKLRTYISGNICAIVFAACVGGNEEIIDLLLRNENYMRVLDINVLLARIASEGNENMLRVLMSYEVITRLIAERDVPVIRRQVVREDVS